MTEAGDICLAILAAGASRRFGATDKLTANLRGKMLGLHAAENFAPLGFGKAVVIAAHADHPCAAGWNAAGFEIIFNPLADSGMGSSVAAAARAAEGLSALLICLADMPFVPASHILNMIASLHRSNHGTQAIIASRAGSRRLPPALFAAAHFGRLSALKGDRGAHELLADSETVDSEMVDIDAAKLIDIDRPETLAAVNCGHNGDLLRTIF